MLKKVLCMLLLLISAPALGVSATSAPVIATVGVGFNPHGVTITHNGRLAYVANNNNNSVPGGNTVSVIDVATNTLVTTISDPSFNEPYTVTFSADDSTAYVTNSGGTTITIIDVATNTVTGTIGGFDGPSGMVILPDGVTAYVNNYGAGFPNPSGAGNTLSVVDLSLNAIVDTITLSLVLLQPAAPAAVAMSPNGAFVYSINYGCSDNVLGAGTMSVVRTSDNTVIATIPGFSGPFSIAVSPDGTRAYVTNFGSNNFTPVGTTVSVVDLTTNTIKTTINNVGIQPSGAALTPDGKYLFVTIYHTLYLGPNFTNLTPFQGLVKVIRTCDNKILSPAIIVGDSPSQVAITPDGHYAYVTNYSDDTVSVISIGFERAWLASMGQNCWLEHILRDMLRNCCR